MGERRSTISQLPRTARRGRAPAWALVGPAAAGAALLVAGAAAPPAGPTGREAPPADGDLKRQLPHIPPTEPRDSIATFKVEPGFAVELAAAESRLCATRSTSRGTSGGGCSSASGGTTR